MGILFFCNKAKMACRLFWLKKNEITMKPKLLFFLLFVITSFQSFSHDPHWRYRNRPYSYCHPLFPLRVIVAPPRFLPPPPVYFSTRVVVRSAPRPITAYEAIANAKQMVKDQQYDSDRLRIAKSAVEDLPLRCVDVLDLLNMLEYESSRLELAKYCYDKVEDKENFSVIYEGFKYDSSLRHLEDFMYNRR